MSKIHSHAIGFSLTLSVSRETERSNMKKTLVTAALTLMAANVYGDPLNYECEIRSVKEIGANGLLEDYRSVYQVGAKFHIEKRTGVILGAGIGNSAYEHRQVLDPGSKEMSYKLLSIGAPVAVTPVGRNTIYVEVKEWADSYFKPFIVVAGGTVLTGVCR